MSKKIVTKKAVSEKIVPLTDEVVNGFIVQAKELLETVEKNLVTIGGLKKTNGELCFNFINVTMTKGVKEQLKEATGMSLSAWLEHNVGKKGQNAIYSASSYYKKNHTDKETKKNGAKLKSVAEKALTKTENAIATIRENGLVGVSPEKLESLNSVVSPEYEALEAKYNTLNVEYSKVLIDNHKLQGRCLELEAIVNGNKVSTLSKVKSVFTKHKKEMTT